MIKDDVTRIEKIEHMALAMRHSVLEMSLAAGGNAAHIGAGLSLIEILASLYGEIMNLDPKDPFWPDRDRFILSKGHGVLGYYAALHAVGYIDKDELATFEHSESALLGHPVRCLSKGIEFTNGSLGMGISIAVGLAYALKRKGQTNKVYVLLGDGECNEGSVWEALMSATQFSLDNLIVIIDHNGFQLGGENTKVMSLEPIEDKFKAFIANTYRVDGHDIKQLLEVFKDGPKAGQPLLILADTVKGKGCAFSEGNNEWHHAILTQKTYEEEMKRDIWQKLIDEEGE